MTPRPVWILVAANCVAAWGALARAAEPDRPLELQPYRVLVSVAFAADALLTNEFRTQVVHEVEQRNVRCFYRMWDQRVEENTWLAPADRAGLERVAPEDLQTRFANNDYDKVCLVTVELDGSQYVCAAREWDAAAWQFGATVVQQSLVREGVAAAIAQALAGAFRPVLTFETADADVATLRLRAAAFPPSDPAATQLEPGDLLQAFFRYRDFEGVVQRVQFLPWTYLVVEQVDRERVTCRLASGLRAALGGARRRVETLAIRLHAVHDSTHLRLVRTDSTQPLVGHQVRVFPKPLSKDEPQTPLSLAVTDRQGAVRLERRPDQPLVWLYVQSGEALLARVPYVPGTERSATLPVPDDSVRLSVESELEILQGELVEVIAQRAQLALRARKLAENDDWESADKELERLRALPGTREFRARLTTIQVPALEAARAQQNRLAESRINKLCEEMLTLIDRYLDDQKIRALEERIAELRPAAQPANTP